MDSQKIRGVFNLYNLCVFFRVSLLPVLLLVIPVATTAQSKENNDGPNKTATIFAGLVHCGQNFRLTPVTTRQELQILYPAFVFKSRAEGYYEVVSEKYQVPQVVNEMIIPQLRDRYQQLSASPSCTGMASPTLVRLNDKSVGTSFVYSIAMVTSIALLLFIIFMLYRVSKKFHAGKTKEQQAVKS